MDVSFVTAKLITSEDALARKQAHEYYYYSAPATHTHTTTTWRR